MTNAREQGDDFPCSLIHYLTLTCNARQERNLKWEIMKCIRRFLDNNIIIINSWYGDDSR